MECIVCLTREARYPSCMCGGCYARLHVDVGTLVGAHTWLGVAMRNPTPAWKPGAIHRPSGPRPPFQVQLHDARVDIAAKLTSWAKLIAEEHTPALAGPADSDPATIGRWLGHRLRWVSEQLWCDEMARELNELARSAYALVPWDRERRQLPLPCPGCDLLTLVLYGGQEWVSCRNPECGALLSWADYWLAVQEQHARLTVLAPRMTAPTITGVAA